MNVEAEVIARFDSTSFSYKKQHEGDDAALRCYKSTDDDDTDSGKALAIKLNKRLIQRGDFFVLGTPAVEDLAVGTYQITVRMKMLGMLNSLGTGIVVKVGDRRRQFYPNEFAEEDVYQEFTMDFEVREGDVVAHKYIPIGKSGFGPDNLVESRETAEELVAAIKGKEESSWRDRFVAQIGKPTEYADTSNTAFRQLLRQVIQDADGKALVFNEAAPGPTLSEALIDQINRIGALPATVNVELLFEKNIWGRGLSGSRGASTPAPSLRTVTVDWAKIEKLPEPDHIVLRDIRPVYPWRRPGEAQKFLVWMHNRSGRDQENALRLTLTNGLGKQQLLLSQKMALRDGGYELFEWLWQVPNDQHRWGQEVLAEILVDGRAVSTVRAWFAVHPFNNAVMIPARGNASRYYDPYTGSPPTTQTHRELFGAACTIYDSAGVVPDPEVFFEPYVVGNGGYWMSIPTLNVVTHNLVAHAIAPFFYLESNGSATRALEMFWDHPDWVPVLPANTDEFYMKRLAAVAKGWPYWREQLKKRPPERMPRAGGAYSGQLVSLNGLIKANVDRVIAGTLKLAEHTALTGVRWDGLPFKAFNTKALGGGFGRTGEELDRISAANVARFRREVRARFPNFELRANYGFGALMDKQENPFDFDAARQIIDRDPHVKGLLKGHGSVMEEAWMGYAGFGVYTNNCRNYLRACRFETAAVQYAGGHHGHMLWFYDSISQYTPDEIYQQLFSLLGGAHLDAAFGPIVESRLDLGVYATRFSEYFWDPELRPIAELENKISVDVETDIWYYDSGFEKTDENGNLLYIIPFINPPVTELWLRNRFGLLPPPIREPFAVTVQIPDGCRGATAVYLLDNDPVPAVRKLEFDSGEGEVTFEVPELIIFKVAVIRFSKA